MIGRPDGDQMAIRFFLSFEERCAVTRSSNCCWKSYAANNRRSLFHFFFFFFSFLFQKDYTRGVVNATEREKGKNGFCRLYRGLIAVDVTTNIVVPPLGQYRTSQERKRVVVARRIRLPILPMLIIPISIAGT